MSPPPLLLGGSDRSDLGALRLVGEKVESESPAEGERRLGEERARAAAAAQCRSASPEGHHTRQGKVEAPAAAAAPPRRRRELVALLLTGFLASTRVPNARPPQPLDAVHLMNAGGFWCWQCESYGLGCCSAHVLESVFAVVTCGITIIILWTSSTDKNSRFHHDPWSQILLKLIKFDIQKGTALLSGSGCWFLATMVAGTRA
ncbi:uncharacterized protein LOC123404711 [Hordeum vulgare subsp. vulgare]|uniref:Predicted protein n=1 Tax=Hordeum vulgare subsp. vulgare TaxID=112509 RepID=F2EIZ2_HORVV|nr:uncharacterized protein LOC123404711 [Hordeum vulgare subsp. vulgare]BAK07314.1 predicted protein [Hordeum vulgare subsp. vulgare]